VAAFESKPYDGRHRGTLDPGNDWRNGTGLGGLLDRTVSYGNYAGVGNRNQSEGGYHPPIDGIDAAAERHDAAYNARADAGNPFTSWEGLRAVAPDDRQLVADVNAEMAANGDRYSEDAEGYSRGMRGFFGGRAMGVGAIDWLGDKGAELGAGLGSFLDSARGWDDLGDAGGGLIDGIGRAGSWLQETGGEAWEGVAGAADQTAALGPRGAWNTLAGLGNVAAVGAGHLAGRAWDGVKDGAASLFGWLAEP
jgi:hypothetical protein